jgi:hypothetical protein
MSIVKKAIDAVNVRGLYTRTEAHFQLLEKKMTNKKKTVGEISTDLLAKSHENKHTAYDQMQEQLTDYDKNLYECVDNYKKKYQGDFFVAVLTKKEHLMANVIRHYFIARQTCPTPNYDQAVYKYNATSCIIEFIWVIPSKPYCLHMLDNYTHLGKEELELFKFVVDFAEGTLFKKAKALSGEKEDSIELEKGKTHD